MNEQFFKKGAKKGKYYEALLSALELINHTYLNIRATQERNYEDRIAASIGAKFGTPQNGDPETKFMDQRDRQEPLTRVTLFNCDHRPDMSIGRDGVAVEVKRVEHGSSIRNAIGQCITYRHGYRFVILVAVDESAKDKPIKKLFATPMSPEAKLKEQLEELSIYVVII